MLPLKLRGMQEKESNMSVRCGCKIPSLEITVLHHSAKPNSDPRDGIFYPHLTPMQDSYNIIFTET